MIENVYINDIGVFLPNGPIDNDEIENVLGMVGNIPSRTKRIVLRNNKIKTRYYAINPSNGKLTHNNAQLTALAARNLNPYKSFDIKDIECLCCGTASPDLLFPGHALMVMGELGLPECEAMSTSGICISGVNALKNAYMNVALGISQNAVSTGSELSSSFLRSAFFKHPPKADVGLDKKPMHAFDSDFLRWMLSDGAGAIFLSSNKDENRISLKIEWIEVLSFAGELETCMYAGGVKDGTGKVTGWREIESLDASEQQSLFLVKQDIRLLGKEIVRTAMNRTLAGLIEKHKLRPENIDWFLPHYSSGYFRDKFYNGMKEVNFEIPY
ncbi:MAG: hypothetical protein GY864_14345, partial [Desulfobacterales bacterium]|nr:hypothetical protein [Desulfobacterales bacterium]